MNPTRIQIVLTDGTQIETDAIFSIHFEIVQAPGTPPLAWRRGCHMVTIKGWKDGLNQTEDTFEIQDIASIHFPAKD